MLTPDGKIKPWREMTPEECLQEKLRHFPTLLKRWKGGQARMYELTSSHKTLTIRIERSKVKGNLHVACLAPLHIHGPLEWSDCDLEIAIIGDSEFVVR